MAKKTTLDELATMIEHVIAFMTANMATKEQIFALQTQVNSIEGQLRNNGRLEVRVGDLEEKVFGEVRT
jgi:hypothetical protein